MKKFIVKSVWLSLAYLICSIPAQAQFIATQYRYVATENSEEFITKETTYWSEVAKEAIKQGKMVKWELWQKVSGWKLDEGTNFLSIFIIKFQCIKVFLTLQITLAK